METLFHAKIPKGGEIRVTEEKLSIFKGIDKTVIPILQIADVSYLPWPEDTNVFITTSSGVKSMFPVKPEDKEKIKQAIHKAQEIYRSKQ